MADLDGFVGLLARSPLEAVTWLADWVSHGVPFFLVLALALWAWWLRCRAPQVAMERVYALARLRRALRRARKKAKQTWHAGVLRCGVPAERLKAIEHGEVRPTCAELECIARWLQLDLDELDPFRRLCR